MGLARDSVLADVHNTGASAIGLTAAAPATGDSFVTRSFPASAYARLEGVTFKGGGTSRQVQVKSPVFHDDVRGIQFTSSDLPAILPMPRETGQPLAPADTLVVQLDAAATSDTVALLEIFYSDLPGIAARLHSWGDIAGLIKSIKPVEVDCTCAATIGQWSDTVWTATEQLLHANTDYAVLGYIVDVAICAVGLRGQETGNLRYCGPGTSRTFDTSEYFVAMSEKSGLPHIPVVNAANVGSIYASVADSVASTAVKAQFILAELSQNLST